MKPKETSKAKRKLRKGEKFIPTVYHDQLIQAFHNITPSHEKPRHRSQIPFPSPLSPQNIPIYDMKMPSNLTTLDYGYKRCRKISHASHMTILSLGSKSFYKIKQNDRTIIKINEDVEGKVTHE